MFKKYEISELEMRTVIANIDIDINENMEIVAIKRYKFNLASYGDREKYRTLLNTFKLWHSSPHLKSIRCIFVKDNYAYIENIFYDFKKGE